MGALPGLWWHLTLSWCTCQAAYIRISTEVELAMSRTANGQLGDEERHQLQQDAKECGHNLKQVHLLVVECPNNSSTDPLKAHISAVTAALLTSILAELDLPAGL